MPRKSRVLSKKEIEEVYKLSCVLSRKHMADYLCMSESTFERILRDQPEVETAYKKGRSDAIGEIGGGLLAKARDGDLGAMIFYLKTQARWREKSELEVKAVLKTNHVISFE